MARNGDVPVIDGTAENGREQLSTRRIFPCFPVLGQPKTAKESKRTFFNGRSRCKQVLHDVLSTVCEGWSRRRHLSLRQTTPISTVMYFDDGAFGLV
jgi:hypothetical protein